MNYFLVLLSSLFIISCYGQKIDYSFKKYLENVSTLDLAEKEIESKQFKAAIEKLNGLLVYPDFHKIASAKLTVVYFELGKKNECLKYAKITVLKGPREIFISQFNSKDNDSIQQNIFESIKNNYQIWKSEFEATPRNQYSEETASPQP